jgi:hypothetical protein
MAHKPKRVASEQPRANCGIIDQGYQGTRAISFCQKEANWWLATEIDAESNMNSKSVARGNINRINGADSVGKQNGLYRKKNGR